MKSRHSDDATRVIAYTDALEQRKFTVMPRHNSATRLIADGDAAEQKKSGGDRLGRPKRQAP